MIIVEKLMLTYPGAQSPAVRGVDFSIKKGEIFGFLGPNGAGKSTTQKSLCGLLKGYTGNITILGKNLREWGCDLYERVGVCFELPNHYLKLTGLENLKLFASLYAGATEDPGKLLEMVGLEGDANLPVGHYSKGMKVRLNFVRALLNQPDVLFLDEPTGGIDPGNARVVKDIILAQKQQGKTIFLTTHNMPLADELCDRVGFMVGGELKLVNSPRELKLQKGERKVKVEYIADGKKNSQEFSLEHIGENRQFLELLNKAQIETIHTKEANLEDIFLEVTGRQLA